jgi:hypothetical protein
MRVYVAEPVICGRKPAGSRVCQLSQVRNAWVSIEYGLYRAAKIERIANQANSLVGSRNAWLILGQCRLG